MPKIQVSATPNPDSLKLTLSTGRFIETGMESFSTPEEAERHPLGRRLFALAGVSNVFILPQFVTVTKHPAADWDLLVPKIEQAMSSYLDEASL